MPSRNAAAKNSQSKNPNFRGITVNTKVKWKKKWKLIFFGTATATTSMQCVTMTCSCNHGWAAVDSNLQGRLLCGGHLDELISIFFLIRYIWRKPQFSTSPFGVTCRHDSPYWKARKTLLLTVSLPNLTCAWLQNKQTKQIHHNKRL